MTVIPSSSKVPCSEAIVGELASGGRWLATVLMVTTAFFGIWTIGCNIIAFFGLPFTFALGLGVIAALGAVALAGRAGAELAICLNADSETAVAATHQVSSLTLVAVALCGVVVTQLVSAYAGWAILLAGIGWLVVARPLGPASGCPPAKGGTAVGTREIAVVVAIAVLLAALALAVSRPDADDGGYLGWANSVVDHPELPPFSYDVEHGEPGMPFLLPPSRYTSFELLGGTLARLLGLPVANVHHQVILVISAVLVVVGWWVLARLLVGKRALVALAAAVLIALAWGEGHRTFGNFFVVRLFQNKGVLVSLAVPVTIVMSIYWMRSGSWRSWCMLMLAQAVTLGVSSTGIIVGPLAMAIGIISEWHPDRLAVRRMVLAVLSALWPVVVILLLVRDVGGKPAMGSVLPELTMLGGGMRPWLALAALPVALLLGRLSGNRRVGRFCLAVVLVGINPILNDFLSAHVVNNQSWRQIFSVPWPLLIGMAVALGMGRWSVNRRGKAVAVATVLAFAVFIGGGRWTLSAANGVSFCMMCLKTPEAVTVAERTVSLAREASPGRILAPDPVTTWLPAIPHHPRIVLSGHTYPLLLRLSHDPQTNWERRLRLFAAVSTGIPDDDTAQLFVNDMLAYDVTIVVIPAAAAWSARLEHILVSAGFHASVEKPGPSYRLWMR